MVKAPGADLLGEGLGLDVSGSALHSYACLTRRNILGVTGLCSHITQADLINFGHISCLKMNDSS